MSGDQLYKTGFMPLPVGLGADHDLDQAVSRWPQPGLLLRRTSGCLQKAADAGLDCLKYNVQMVGITRTGLKPGRGGVQNSSFVHAEYSSEDDAKQLGGKSDNDAKQLGGVNVYDDVRCRRGRYGGSACSDNSDNMSEFSDSSESTLDSAVSDDGVGVTSDILSMFHLQSMRLFKTQ